MGKKNNSPYESLRQAKLPQQIFQVLRHGTLLLRTTGLKKITKTKTKTNHLYFPVSLAVKCGQGMNFWLVWSKEECCIGLLGTLLNRRKCILTSSFLLDVAWDVTGRLALKQWFCFTSWEWWDTKQQGLHSFWMESPGSLDCQPSQWPTNQWTANQQTKKFFFSHFNFQNFTYNMISFLEISICICTNIRLNTDFTVTM